MIITFLLFTLAVAAVWSKALPISTFKVPLWSIFFIAGIGIGFFHHFLEWSAVVAIAAFALLACTFRYTENYPVPGTLHLIFIGGMALLLGLGKLPRFHNPDIATNLRFSAEGLPFTQRLRIDGISAGIILLAIFCRPARTRNEWLTILRLSAPIIFVSLIVIFGCGIAFDYVALDVKFIPYTVIFLIANFLFTCVIEESFFRGFLQDNFSQLLHRWKYGAWIALILVAVLFGLAHFKGGLLYIGLATLAGLFYGYAKYRVKHIEAAIVTHFSVNAVHVIAFTYPNF